MAENTIEIAITAESVNNQKRAVQVLKDAFKKQLAQDTLKNEAAVYPLLTPLVYDMKEDVKSAKNSLESYKNLSIENFTNIVNPELGTYEDLNSISGNYSLTPEDAKDIKDQANRLAGKGAKNATAADRGALAGSRFTQAAQAGSPDGANLPEPAPEKEETEDIFEAAEPRGGYNTPPQPPDSIFNMELRGKKKDWLQQCVPCFPRPSLGNLRPEEELFGMLENSFANRYEQLIRRWKTLFEDPSIYDDLCEIGNFLNEQCVPDLRAMLALMSLYSAKIADIKFISPQNMFMAMIGPIFAPIFQGISDLLDKYIQLIVSPILCVLNSLDKQIAKLDVLTPTDQALVASISTLDRRINSLRRTKERLIERKNLLESGEYEESRPASAVTGFLTSDGTGLTSKQRELRTINSDISRIKQKLPEAIKQRDKLRSQRDAVASYNVFGKARNQAQEARAGLGKGLKQIRLFGQKGVDFVDGTLETIKSELERLIFGRAASAEDMLQGAEDLQKISRVISMLRGFMEFAEKFLEGDLCKEPGNALNNLVSSSGFTDATLGDGSGPTMKFIKTSGENGEPLLLVTSSENVVELEGEDQTRQPIEGNGIIEIDSIAGKKLRATSEFGEPAIIASMPFNLCGKKEGTSASSLAKVKQWAEESNL